MDWEDDNIFTSKQQTPILIYGFADGNKLFVHTFRCITTNETPSQGCEKVIGSPIQLDNMYANEGMLMEN
jgi:hypothetical protein